MSHYMIICSKCNTVIEQCRCPSQDKEKQYELCDKCKSQGQAPHPTENTSEN